MRQQLIDDYYDSEEYLAKLRARASIMKQLEENPYERERRVMDVWAIDPVPFIEDLLWLKLTENGGTPKPFFLFDYQVKIIRRLQEAEMSGLEVDLLVDKPRGMGLTWLISAYFLWRFMYTPNYSALILSRKEDLVDDGTALPDLRPFRRGRVRRRRGWFPRFRHRPRSWSSRTPG